MNRILRRPGKASAAPALAVVLLALVATTAPAQTFTVLHTFHGGQDGIWPRARLVQDASGRLYGTTFLGGRNLFCTTIGCGVVFTIEAPDTETVVQRFVGVDGSMPVAGLL